MVYAVVLEATDESHGGSSPLLGTILLRSRLTAGQQVLILLIVVRIHAPQPFFGQVGEWLNPIDCKSITPWVTLVRI